jgi:hypothetical protein
MDDQHPGRKDASGDIRVGLDSSIPCWNDAIWGASASGERNYFTDIPKEPRSRRLAGAENSAKAENTARAISLSVMNTGSPGAVLALQ